MIEQDDRTAEVETARVVHWEPPTRLVLEWRGADFAPDEKTEDEVQFDERTRGTQVTVTHRGWSRIRPDHPARPGCRSVHTDDGTVVGRLAAIAAGGVA